MIIQRWQSLLLLIAAVLMGVFSFVSLGQIQSAFITFDFTALGFTPEGITTVTGNSERIHTYYFFAVSIISAILPLITIFTFKQFNLQKLLCKFSIFMIAITIAYAAVLAYTTVDGATVSWSSWVCAPFISLIATIAAHNRISADHRKILDSERLI